jgi:hypothetical protein
MEIVCVALGLSYRSEDADRGNKKTEPRFDKRTRELFLSAQVSTDGDNPTTTLNSRD